MTKILNPAVPDPRPWTDDHPERPIEWYKSEHLRLTHRVGCLRRNIKQLQRAHDRTALWASEASRRRSQSDEIWRSEVNRLKKQLDDSRAKEAKPWGYAAVLGVAAVMMATCAITLLAWLHVHAAP